MIIKKPKKQVKRPLKKEKKQSTNFIKTKGAMQRVQTVIDGIKSGIPLLLEGETGTSKTSTAKQAAEEIKQKVIIFNFSSQTSVEDLLGRVSKNNDSWSGFSFIKGPYTRAFEEGYCLILDEINLAHETVLQCIEASLDSRKLSLDFAGNEADKTIMMHPDFHLIATQNPLTNRFSQKRNFLSHKFTSRFQKITFNEIDQNELIEIATQLSTNIEKMTPNLVRTIVRFHFEWQNNKFSKSSAYYVFTIREICRTIKSIEKGLTPFESILINYGARYNDQTKSEMIKLLNRLGIIEEGNFFNENPNIKQIIKKFSLRSHPKIIQIKEKNCFYLTETLENVFSTSFHLFDNFQSILIVGPDGCGKTSIGRWIGELYSSLKKDEADINCKFFICNPEMMISDVIGRYVLYKKENKTIKDEIIKEIQVEWKYGPVVEAMKNGDCLILDQVDIAPSTILERLNSLFDGLGQKGYKFPVQENLENPKVPVDPNFRIIATSSLEGLNNLSPAFLNRFTIIYVKEQLDSIGDELNQFIRCASPYAFQLFRGTGFIDIITNTIKEIHSRLIKESKLTSLNLSRCVDGFFKLRNKYPEQIKKKDIESILDFCLHACIYHSKEIPDISDEFINTMLNELDDDEENNSQFDTFHFKEAKSTQKVMATLVACSIIGLHTILVGRTGIGKTAAAMAFSRTLKSNKIKSSTSHIISFNGETQLEDLYGYFTIEDGNFTDHHGELSQAMSDGQVFIADELNLAEQQIIQSLNVAIEPSSGENIILPVTGSSITIKEGFFFIGCQNDLTMKGRKQLPESIQKKVLCINYPEPSREDFKKLCVSIAKPFHIDNAIPHSISILIQKMNADTSLKSWSLREVRILFRRISYFQSQTKEAKNFTALHHVAFMLISIFKDNPSMINKIANLICTSFYQEKEVESLMNDLTADIKVSKYIDGNLVSQSDIDSLQQKSEIKSDSVYLVKMNKGSLELNINNKQLFLIPDNIQQLWQTIFEVYLTYPSEPLLFNGPSGFKTYLSGLISSLSPVIYLHSDSTVSSLIGQITLLDRHQAKINLFDSLYDFAGYNLSSKEALNEIKTNYEYSYEFDEKSILSVVEMIKKSLPKSLVPIVQNVANRLINIQHDELDQQSHLNMFSNFISLFKPGLITRSIFSQNSLILKNFAQPSPSVIERLNELLSVTPTLTLFEDTTNTYTSELHNKLYGFLNNFRIIGICSPFEKRNLSDAMLSRLTEIQTSGYSDDDQINVFMTYIQNQTEKQKTLFILKQALELFKKYKFNITFRQKIQIIEVSNQWQKKYPKMNLNYIYSISILRCAGGSLSFENRQKLFNSMENNSFHFYKEFSNIYQTESKTEHKSSSYKYTSEKSCLSLNKEDGTITSSLTYFAYPNISFSNNFIDKKSNLRFSKNINDLIDAIFSFSIINYPLIIEGPNGCGKSSAFFYVAQCLGMNVIQINLSQSTTIEDIFGRSEPSTQGDSIHFEFKPTTFLNAIDNARNNGEKHWILIDNLHLASPSVIDALEPIFNSKSDHVTLPDGSFVQKSNFFVVGLLTKPLQKQSITNTAIYHKMPNYTKEEFSEICQFILETNELNDSIQQICPILSQLYEISSSSQIKSPVTPREAHKFVKMMKAASKHSNVDNKFTAVQICQLLSLGRFYDEELKAGVIQNINEAVKSQVFTFQEEIPEFSIENNQTLSTKKVFINSSSGIQKYMNDINHLTISEKQLFEFLILNIDKYTPILIQGPTASGKTFSIQLFANILGKDLKVLQMNQEINSSFIAGSYSPSKDLNSNDINELRNALELLSNMVDLLPKEFQGKLNNIEIDKWKLSDFMDLKKQVEKLMKSSSLSEDNFNSASEFINKINSTLLIFKHIDRNDSIIIKALTRGEWLLLDGIESATPDFLDRILSLLDDPPVLNLYERGNDYNFSMNPNKNDKSIHPNFRLFLTYNPVNSYSNNVSQSFISRCTLYSMSPIDSYIFDSAVVVSNIIDKSVFSFSSQSEISARIAQVHMKMKELKQKQLTCRTLIHISREILYRNKIKKLDQNQLVEIIRNHYSYNVSPIYNGSIDNKLVNHLEKIEMNTIKIRNFMIDNIKELYMQIESILKNKSDLKLIFKYDEFLPNMHILQFKDYKDIVSELEKVHRLIKDNTKQFTKQQLSYLASFHTLSELFIQISQIIKKSKDGNQNLSLSQVDSTRDSKFSDVLFQFHSFQFLFNNHFYLDHIPDIFLDFETFYEENESTDEPYRYDKDIIPIQQLCNTFFKSEDCSCLFTGLMKDFYIFSYSIFSDKNITYFSEWINWLNQFFNSFKSIINDFNITFEKFKVSIQRFTNNKDPNSILSLFNQIEKIKQIPKYFEEKADKYSVIKDTFSFIDNLYKNLHNLYLNTSDNKKNAEYFLEIKKRCEKIIKDDRYKKPISYYIEYVNSLDEEQISNNIGHFINIYNSIINYFKKQQKESKESKQPWPTNENLGSIKEVRSLLFESLISYSTELQKLANIDINNPQWSSLCELSDPDPLLKEFIFSKKILKTTKQNYISFLNAQLLTNIFESNGKDPYDYCSRSQLIELFNKFISNNNIEPSWLKIVQNASRDYPANFLISIPSYDAVDIVSLLVNPLTKLKGCFFKENEIPQDLVNDFYKIYDHISNTQIDRTFEYVNEKIQKTFIQYLRKTNFDKNIIFDEDSNFDELINNIFDDNKLKGIHNLCNKILCITNLCEIQEKQENNKLDFSDVQRINFDDFNSFINNNPQSGYYIAQFPEVQNNLKIVQKLCTRENIEQNKMPLSLFIYRIISRMHKIQFQLPAEFPLSFSEEFLTTISKHLNSKNSKNFKFSNLIGFLLMDPPHFVQDTQYSKYVRNIIINLMTTHNDNTLLKEIMHILTNLLPKIIDNMGSSNWNEILNQELKYEYLNDENNDIINFLSNPWNLILEQINNNFTKEYKNKNDEVKNTIKSILDKIFDFASEQSIKQLKECVEKDETDYQDKRVYQYINNERNNEKESEDIKNLIKYWNLYSKNARTLMEEIQPLPTVQPKSFEYKPHDWYGEFYNFFSEKKSFLSCKEHEVMAIFPKSNNITIKFTKKKKKVSIDVKVEGMALFLHDKGIKYEIIGGDVKIITIPYDPHVLKYKTSKMKDITTSYHKFQKYYEKTEKEDFNKYNYEKITEEIGQAKVFFGSKNVDDLIDEMKKLFEKYKSFDENDFYDKGYILDNIRNDIQSFEIFEPIGFQNEKVEKPHSTIELISEKLTTVITSSKKNLFTSNFELFNEDFKQKYNFINDSKGIFRRILAQSSRFLIKFDKSKIPNIDMDQLKASDSLLVPSIFKKRNDIKATIKEIKINIENLLFGVDVTPLQIRLCNYTNEHIICQFKQDDEKLPLPNYRNETGYVIIEIPVESICTSIFNTKKDKMKKGLNDIENLFVFEGIIFLNTRDNPDSMSQIKYSISLHYISLISFIKITNNHSFAIKNGEAKIVPFIAGPKTKISFEKFTNRDINYINMANSIQELNDNKASKPNFNNEKIDNRTCKIESSFANSTQDTSFLSMNYEFCLSKNNAIPVELKIDTFPRNNNLYLAVYSDDDVDFKESDGRITIGNISRKVYFFIGYLNIGNEPISPTSIELNSDNYHVQAKFNEMANIKKIQPNKYGCIISFFEVRYCGCYHKHLNTINASLTVKIGEVSKTINFLYQINLFNIDNDELHYIKKCKTKYYKNKLFNDINIKNIDNEFWEMENRILVSPYSYIFNNKKNYFPSVKYNKFKGSFISYTNESSTNIEVLEFTSKLNLKIQLIEKAKTFSLDPSKIYLFARLEDRPETFFPLFCPKVFTVKKNNTIEKIDKYFDIRKCTSNNVEINFNEFYIDLFEKDEKMNIGGSFEFIFKRSPSSSNNFTVIINELGNKYNIIKFSRLINPIKEFTNCNYFEDHYYNSINNLFSDKRDDQKYQFFSYISALNEIALNRYEDLQASCFYLTLPINFELIQKQQQQMLSSQINEKEIPNCKYAKDFSMQTKQENEFEDNNIKDFEKNGFEITSILKWSQSKGIESSNINELNRYKEKSVSLKYDIESVKNDDSSSDSSLNNVKLIEFPRKVTLLSLHDFFDKIYSLTSMLPFSIYSLKKNNISLTNAKELIGQLLSIHAWQKDSAECFPFSSFRTKFLQEFDAMITRLLGANIKITGFNSQSKNIENFIEKPSPLPVDMKVSIFKQLGNTITASKSSSEFVNEKNSIKPKKEPEQIKPIPKPIKKISSKIVIYNVNTTSSAGVEAIPTTKNVVFEDINENTKEIPDTDFIQYLIQEMTQKNIDDTIEYKKSTDSHIPKSIKGINNIGIGNKRIEPFIEASMKLSDTLINGINKSSNFENLLNNKDTIYSSILVDCSSTLSISHKAALITLVMALGNTLTAIKIPYSIILFCESNFQFILKQVDESHDLIHFEKLLDTITIRRRMSDISSAILMANDKIKSKDENRKNHSMFVLTDGLTPKIRLIEQWKNKILNNPKLSIMFYFLDTLTKENDKKLVQPLWSNFGEGIKKSKSINEVIYSKASSIYNGDLLFIEPFIRVLNNFISENDPDTTIIQPKLVKPISKTTDSFLDNIIDNICKGIIDEQSVYAQYSFPNEISEKFTDIDLSLIPPSPLTSFIAGIEDIKIELINKFLSKIISTSHSLFDNSLLQDISTLVFPPNKPMQYTPSENGNVFYFPGLMKFILTQGQDSKIFLEKKAGLVRSYSVFIVIDNSISCFNHDTYSHSFQTILSLLYPLSKIDIPSLNIIITTSKGPVILCSEKPSMIALEEKSPLWISLFSNLSNPHSIKSHFYAALMSVYQMRVQQKSTSSVLFVLTDGCYSFDERNQFNSIFNAITAMNTITITVGIGMNPKFINLLTDKAIWSQNAKLIWNAILFLFDKEVQRTNNIKTCFSYSQFTNEKANCLENNLQLNKMFPDLFDELNKVIRKIATYRNYYNKDQSNNTKLITNKSSIDKRGTESSLTKSESTEVIMKNQAGAQYDLGKKGYYKGVKLLIVMCWDFTCSDVEDRRISEEVLRNGVDKNQISVVNALIYYGIETKIVKNYKNAINELTKGVYSQVWIICGRMDGTMPGNNDSEENGAYLIDQFVDCVIQYWNKGGGVAFWTDNYPLTAEVNKFLEKAEFKIKKSTGKGYDTRKVNFHIGGDYPGEKMMKRKNNNSLLDLEFEGNVSSECEGYEKELFNHGLYQIFEGITIASAINGREQPNEWKNYKDMRLQFANINDISPFKPFSKSSSGGFSSLYYMSPLDTDTGDIVIDCGFSKLFFELTEEGIDRYVKNIAIWMLQLEKKDIKYGSTKDARLVVPPKFYFRIQPKINEIEFHKFDQMKNVDLVFLVDGTGSMRYFVEAVRDCCIEIATECHKKFPKREFRYGSVVYRDTIVTEKNPFKKDDKVDLCQLTNDPKDIQKFFERLQVYGGGDDGPEDWVSGYDYLLHKIKWNNDSLKIVIHICDAEGHGKSFTCDPRYVKYFYNVPWFSDKRSIEEDDEVYNEIQNLQDMQFKILIREAAEKGLIFFCLNNHKKSTYCFKKTRDLFLEYGGQKFVVQNQFHNINYNVISISKPTKNISTSNSDDDDSFDENDSEDGDENKELNEKEQNDINLRKQLIDQVKTIVMNAVDAAVAVSHRSGESEYERKCMEVFEDDFREEERFCQMYYTNPNRENHIRILKRRGRRGRGGRRGRRGRKNIEVEQLVI